MSELSMPAHEMIASDDYWEDVQPRISPTASERVWMKEKRNVLYESSHQTRQRHKAAIRHGYAVNQIGEGRQLPDSISPVSLLRVVRDYRITYRSGAPQEPGWPPVAFNSLAQQILDEDLYAGPAAVMRMEDMDSLDVIAIGRFASYLVSNRPGLLTGVDAEVIKRKAPSGIALPAANVVGQAYEFQNRALHNQIKIVKADIITPH